MSGTVVALTAGQKRLLGVKDTDAGFVTAKQRQPSTDGTSLGPMYTPSSFTSHSSFTGSSTPLGGSPYTPTGSPLHYISPGQHSRTPSPSSSLLQSPRYGDFSAGSYHSGSYSGAFPQSATFWNTSQKSVPSAQSSFSASFSRPNTASPLTPASTLSPLFRDTRDTPAGLRARFNVSSRLSPMTSEDSISGMKALEQYLREQEEKESVSHLGSLEGSPSGGPSFWNYSYSLSDFTPVLRKYQYQTACRSPQSTKSTSDPDDPATYRGAEVWSKVGVHMDQVELWIENLRKWLSQTIMFRLASEIKRINGELARLGSEDMQIGEVSISALKQLAVTKSQVIPTLNSIVPFLEVCSNQEYLVKRINELGTSGCMSDFKWNGGGEYKGKAWGEHLPTDAAIVMYMLCTYLDMRLPPHPLYPDGKTFTSQHFMKTPDKPDLKKDDNLLLYQSKINAPHYKVIIGDDTWDLPRGRNNMFQAILLFFHHIKTKQNGMLGRINLGLSGINILWILEQ